MNNVSLLIILILYSPFYINAFPLAAHKIGNEFPREFTNLSSDDYTFQFNGNLSSNPFETMATNISNSLHEQTREKESFIFLMTFSVLASFCMLINIRAFYIVFITSKRKSRPANILVAHLSSVIIVFTFISYMYILEIIDIVDFSLPGLCTVVTFLRKVLYNVLSVNTVAIIWARVTADAVILRKSVAYRVIGMTWAITMTSNLPSILMAENVISSTTNMGKCTEMNLFGSIAATIAYDVFRLLLFNVLASLYLIRAAIKIRSALRFLHKYKLTHSATMLGRTKQARLVYCQTILFIVNWLPLGFGALLYRILNRSGWNDTYINYLTPLAVLYSNVIIFSPLSYVYLIEKMSIAEIIAPCFSSKRWPNPPANLATSEKEHEGILDQQLKPNFDIGRPNTSEVLPTGNETKNTIPDQSLLTSEMSRFSTVEITEFSGSKANSMTNICALPQSFFAQSSSIPASRTRVTSLPMQNVTVEVHSEPSKPNAEDEVVPQKCDSETYV